MSITRLKIAIPGALLLLLLTLAACGGSASTHTPTPAPRLSPAPDRGMQLLAQANQKLNRAQTLHALIDISIAGPAVKGTITSEIWNHAPAKNRTDVLQSSIAQLSSGTITVSDGEHIWQYDPQKNVVYSGQINNTGAGTPTTGANTRDESQMIFNLVRSVFTHSNAALVSSSANINGHAAYDIAITSPAQSGGSNTGNFNYSGDVYLDKTTNLPLRVALNVQGLGQITLDLLTLSLNQPLDQSLFIFTPPPGVKVLPFPTENSPTGALSLAQAQQQAGYHLLSIPAAQTAYQLQSVDALGAPGNQIFALNYLYQPGNSKFTISEGKALANLPASGQQVSLRGTSGTLSTAGGVTTLSWTENGVGIQVAASLSNNQLIALANLLA
ncbi:MAG TPA: hypothetical protein VKR83_05230 [Ktedonobacteraceae bacterium]|nr:hypothetical protein [Ktedonobacteraceae bacterium]